MRRIHGWMFYTIIVIWALFGLVAGVIVGYMLYDSRLPECQEDEYLYPAGDYEGPGENKPEEYACFNFDDNP